MDKNNIKKIGSERNNSIDIFRIICAILVVTIHTNPFFEINTYLGYFISQVLSRVSVPFFFSISGYYYICKMEKISDRGKAFSVFFPFFAKTFRLYTFWSVVYIVCDFGKYYHKGVTLKNIIASIIVNFCINGTYYHLWYFIGLFFSILIFTLCYRIRAEKILAYGSIALYAVGLLGCSYYSVGDAIPGISWIINSAHFTWIRRVMLMGLPFFVMGYFVKRMLYRQREHAAVSIFIFAGLFVCENVFINMFKLSKNNVITIFLYILLMHIVIWLLEHPVPEKDKCGSVCRYMANFIYYAHPLLILAFQNMGIENPSIIFVLTVFSSMLIGFFIMKRQCAWLNQFIS